MSISITVYAGRHHDVTAVDSTTSLGDVDLSGQVGAQADFAHFEHRKPPSGSIPFGPSLQYQKEGSPWILGANGQWNYNITSGGLTFKNFNFSLSLSHEF